jgi:hypothetical protein
MRVWLGVQAAREQLSTRSQEYLTLLALYERLLYERSQSLATHVTHAAAASQPTPGSEFSGKAASQKLEKSNTFLTQPGEEDEKDTERGAGLLKGQLQRGPAVEVRENLSGKSVHWSRRRQSDGLIRYLDVHACMRGSDTCSGGVPCRAREKREHWRIGGRKPPERDADADAEQQP